MKLTSGNVDLPVGKSDAIFFDSNLRGFALRVRKRRSDGRIFRTWAIQYRQHGRQRRMNIGDVEKLTAAQARDKARKLLADVELGGDPQGDKQERREKDTNTLRGVIHEYIEHKKTAVKRRTGTPVKASTLRMVRAYLEGPLLKPLHSMPIDRISRRDIATRVIAATKVGAQTAVCFRGAVNALFVWAMQTGLIEHNPAIGALKPEQPPARDRVLSDGELAAIWRGLDVETTEYAAIVRLLICTGCRMSEIGGMRWSEFSPDGASWTLPKERAKTGVPLTLPITDLMRNILDSVPRYGERDLLFGSRSGRGFTDWSRAKAMLDQRLDLPHWMLRDVRRTVSTRMNDIGIQPHIVERILNHALPHIAGTYNKSVYANEVRDAMLRWSDHVRTRVEGGERKVVAFEQRAAATP